MKFQSCPTNNCIVETVNESLKVEAGVAIKTADMEEVPVWISVKTGWQP